MIFHSLSQRVVSIYFTTVYSTMDCCSGHEKTLCAVKQQYRLTVTGVDS